MDLIFLGRQGSGKGTQARILAERFHFAILEMGRESRRLAAEESALGRQMKPIVAAGRLIPPQVTAQVVRDFLAKTKKGQRIIFDSMPRNLAQAKDFWPLLAAAGRDYHLIHFVIDETTALARLAQRLTCTNGSCNAIYRSDYPEKTCSHCNSPLERRQDDDDAAALKMRLQVFAQETMPVIEEQLVLGKATAIDASGDVAQVTADLLTVLLDKQVI